MYIFIVGIIGYIGLELLRLVFNYFYVIVLLIYVIKEVGV